MTTIDRFKKSRLGQIVITAFIASSVSIGIVVWLYEKIRIPTLNNQILFRDDRVGDLRSQLDKEKETSKILASDNDRARMESTKWKTSSEHSLNEIAQLSSKLRQSQEEQLKLSQELSATNLAGLKSSHTRLSSTNNTDLAERAKLTLEEVVNSTADHELIALLAVEDNITALGAVSYYMFNREFEAVRSETPKSITALATYAFSITAKPREYYDFKLALEDLRSYMTKRIHEHYRNELIKADKATLGAFLSQIRKKPEFMIEMADLATKLKSNKNPSGWNTNSMKTVEEFMGSNKRSATNSPTKGSP